MSDVTFMASAEIRRKFLDYFHNAGHAEVASSPLIPANDPTLLFTNAGMVQFKDVFLGQDKRPYTRATTSQRCVRAGGKHNDLDNVGYTARHHTFFEMLGNFSFGDYFKREAMRFAWDFLTKELGLPEEKLWVTVFRDDDEAADIWLKEMKISPERFSRCDEDENFWAMGDTGPCGPCTEIFYDHGPDIPGGPPGTPEADGDRYIEIWNLVFMQYERMPDGSLTPLPKPSVDTGMGLERIAAVMQGVHNNYEIDMFKNIIDAVMKMAGVSDATNHSLRVVADHIRSCAFMVVDGVVPSNEGRGYVLRRIIRRALRHGKKLGLDKSFFHQLVAVLEKEMGQAYPELVKRRGHIEKILLQEEEQFAKTLSQGLQVFDRDTEDMVGDTIPGKTIFQLYDTYGFPPDLTADIARERNLKLDMAGFEQCMAKQRSQSQASGHFKVDYTEHKHIQETSEFVGYDKLRETSVIEAIYSPDGERKTQLTQGEAGLVILEYTPFYAESGGQVGDKGYLFCGDNRFVVHDTQKVNHAIIHQGEMVSGRIQAGDKLTAEVDEALRQATVLNHSATHLLHAALQQVLGDHVVQKGSLVAPTRLRFDFSHYEAVTPAQLREIERRVNTEVRANAKAITEVMSIDDAKAKGAMALFGEKYDDRVRVLQLGETSIELCGGTHVSSTGDIGFFKILSETGIAAGIRRIEAVTGESAYEWVQSQAEIVSAAASALKAKPETLLEKLEQSLSYCRQLEKELGRLKSKIASNTGSNLAEQAVTVKGMQVLAAHLEEADPKSLRETVDRLKDKLGTGVVVLGTANGEKVFLVAGVTEDCTKRIQAGKLIARVAEAVGGKGGGRADMAQAGGTKPEALADALAQVTTWVEAMVTTE